MKNRQQKITSRLFRDVIFLGNTAYSLCERYEFRFLVRLYRNLAGILPYVKSLLYHSPNCGSSGGVSVTGGIYSVAGGRVVGGSVTGG